MKLVRDGLARVIARQRPGDMIKVSERKRVRLLREKLVEEALEFRAAPSLQELGDVLEVIEELLRAHGWSWRELRAAQGQKRKRRGGLREGWVLRRTQN